MQEAGLVRLIMDLDIDTTKHLGYSAAKAIVGESRPMTAVLADDDTVEWGA